MIETTTLPPSPHESQELQRFELLARVDEERARVANLTREMKREKGQDDDRKTA